MDYRFHLNVFTSDFHDLKWLQKHTAQLQPNTCTVFTIPSSSSTMTHAAVHTLEEPSGGSVVFSVDPFLFIEVSLSAVKSQAISVVIQI